MGTQVSPVLLNDFIRYFSGNPYRFGSHKYDESEKIVEGKKEEGQWSGWVKDKFKNFVAPTNGTYQAHLEGKSAMGVCPIDENNCVRFAVLDVDVYSKENSDSIVRFVYRSGLPLLCFRSKSGGLHIYLFLSEPEPAKKVRDLMKKFIPILDLSNKTELFPKQERLRGDDSGSWINLPYFNHEDPRAYLYGEKCELLSLAEAINRIRNKLQTVESLEKFFSSLEYADAPPCLQALALRGGVTEYRNIYLSNFAVYFKNKFGKGEEYENAILEMNTQLAEPLPIKEVRALIDSYAKKDYSYKCKEEPLCSHCSKNECKLREYGIGSTLVSILDYEELTQFIGEVDDDEAYYEWRINGKLLHFNNEQEIIQQEKFRQQCMRKLKILPNKLRQETWTGIINNALQNMKTEKIAEGDDISPHALLTTYLKQFLVGRPLAPTRAQVTLGRVWYEEKDKAYYFRKEALVQFLFDNKKFTVLSRADIARKLKALGKGHHMASVLNIGNGKTTRVMGIPDTFITEEDRFNMKDDDLKVDFKQYNENPF